MPQEGRSGLSTSNLSGALRQGPCRARQGPSRPCWPGQPTDVRLPGPFRAQTGEWREEGWRQAARGIWIGEPTGPARRTQGLALPWLGGVAALGDGEPTPWTGPGGRGVGEREGYPTRAHAQRAHVRPARGGVAAGWLALAEAIRAMPRGGGGTGGCAGQPLAPALGAVAALGLAPALGWKCSRPTVRLTHTRIMRAPALPAHDAGARHTPVRGDSRVPIARGPRTRDTRTRPREPDGGGGALRAYPRGGRHYRMAWPTPCQAGGPAARSGPAEPTEPTERGGGTGACPEALPWHAPRPLPQPPA